MAHTGTGTVQTENGKDVYTIDAPNVRDFAAVCSRYFTVLSQRMNRDGTDTMVSAYVLQDASFGKEQSLAAAVGAVRAYSDFIGPYPYPTLNVVQTDFFIGGMEYPGVVLIDNSVYSEDAAGWLEYIVAHEVGHQWFYGVVGNDQVKEPWLDEALTEYLTLCYYGMRTGARRSRRSMRKTLSSFTCFPRWRAIFLKSRTGWACLPHPTIATSPTAPWCTAAAP